MQDRIAQHFKNEEVIFINLEKKLSWKEGQKKFPRLTRGWYELTRLDGEVRFEFLKDFWKSALKDVPLFHPVIDRFFAGIEKIEVISVKGGVYLTYSKKKGSIFLGAPPLLDEGIKERIDFPIPQSFFIFYRIHDGFFKLGDTGIFSSDLLVGEGQRFKELETLFDMGNQKIPAHLLLPFYRSFGLDVFQCFYKDWYPDGEVGNVLCSLREGTVSDFRTREKGREYLAFPTFFDWLTFYLEDIELE